MTDKPKLSLTSKLSPEMQSKLQQLATKPNAKPDTNKNTVTTETDTKKKEASSSKTSSSKTSKLKRLVVSKEELRSKEWIKHSRDVHKERLDYFSKLYPKCFSNNPKPLAIGIFEVMLEEESKKPSEKRVSKIVLKGFLAKYTRSVAYKESMQLNADRIDLQGKKVGVVKPKHAEFAKKSLEEWRKR